MSNVRVHLDIKDALAAIDGLGKRAQRAIVRAINRSADSGRTIMTQSISRDTGIASKTVRREIVINRATPGSLVAQIFVEGIRLPLIAFQARGQEPSRGRGRGVSYRLPGGRGRNANAFIATMKSGHRGVFKRTTKGRLPITELHGPSLPYVFRKYLPVGQARAKEALHKNIQSEIRFELTR